ncbi:50S ribosomal protein L10 [Candidatus Pacearchaeota archaeon]|nr:50S ribosomal protein L10 [Candidatus Pacearchaeota archaeon]
MTKPITHVSDVKKKTVKELTNLIKEKRTMLIASIKGIPASQFQEMTKKLRGTAIVKVPKKNLIVRAIEESKDEHIKQIEPQIKDSVAILFSDMDCFELSAELVKNKSPAKAKAGQEAPEDLEIPAGPTELIPGPAISELGALGIQIQIDKGKIAIKEPKIVAKKGTKISAGAADVLSKLDIKPFTINLVPIAGYDSKEKKIYLDIKIDREGTIKKLKEAFSRALPFAVNVGYACADTIKFLIQKAGRHEKAIENLTQTNTPEINSGEETKQ